MPDSMKTTSIAGAKWWPAMLFTALAGGMAWGIRGQYGHETGAMIAGLLVSLVLALLFCTDRRPVSVARAVAWGTVAMGIGGTMTYGQTVGLTQDAALVGNWAALRWGMIGLAIKGSIWIGFAGIFLGMGLGGTRYNWRDMLGLMLAMVGAYYIGIALLNSPFDPANKVLPAVYFSDSWYWEPDAQLEPRPEYWGGLLFALATALAYAGWWRKDGLAVRLGLWGVLGGMIGFPSGQCLQACHAWNPDVFREGIWTWLDPHMNWWNMMETTFGAIMGATLGFGLWLNRRRIGSADEPDTGLLPVLVGVALLAAHLALLAAVEFMAIPTVDALYDLGLIMALVPMVGIAGGRGWPYVAIFPMTLLPIAGKTLKQLAYQEQAVGIGAGWVIYFAIPMLIAVAAAMFFYGKSRAARDSRFFLSRALLLSTWMYFLLNYAFLRFPWPWAQWTGRTPNGIIFTVCAAGLTWMAISRGRAARKEAATA